MNVLEKILEEIEEATFQEDAPIYAVDMEVDGYVRASRVKEIIRSHMDEIQNCEGCSRRKWYQKGFEDGKKDNDWIPVEERLPGKHERVIVWDEYRNMEVLLRHIGEGAFDFDNCIDQVDFIVWRPLPEPYKKHRQ